MNKKELVAAIAEQTELTQVDVKKVMDSFEAVIEETLVAGEEVKLTGFMSFKMREQAAREGVNNITKETFHSAAKIVPKASLSRAWRDKVTYEN